MTAFEKLQTGLCALAESRRLASHDQWSAAQLATYGHERLLALLAHAQTHSPFYRDRLAGVRLGPSLELASLPTLDKATMLENFDRLVTDRRLHLAELERHLAEAHGDPLYLGDYRIMATGGTTGRRGLFAYSRRDWREVIGGMTAAATTSSRCRLLQVALHWYTHSPCAARSRRWWGCGSTGSSTTRTGSRSRRCSRAPLPWQRSSGACATRWRVRESRPCRCG
jgi:hypothetical protein